MIAHLLVILFYIACYEPTAQVQDLQFFREAQLQNQAIKSIPLCINIQNESMKGECIWFTAQKAITQAKRSRLMCRKELCETSRGKIPSMASCSVYLFQETGEHW